MDFSFPTHPCSHFAFVAVQMIGAVHGNDTGHLRLSSVGRNHLQASGTAGRESLVVAVQTVGLVLLVHSEGNAVQRLLKR